MEKALLLLLLAIFTVQFTASNKKMEEPIKFEVESFVAESNNEVRYKVYQAALLTLIDNCIFPDGSEADSDEGSKFAIQDIDGDNREELLISYQAATMAGMQLGIYDYDETTGSIYKELTEFPFAVFYDNNLIAVEASHNHGKSFIDNFWPYNLYQYDEKADKYQILASVDAWQKEYFEEDFPIEVDSDQNGIIYYFKDDAGKVTYLDDTDYQAWRNGYLEKAEIMSIVWNDLEKNSIRLQQ